jgi:histidinol-phosphate aminotransferase
MSLSRRSFFGGVAAALGYAGLRPTQAFGQSQPRSAGTLPFLPAAQRARVAEYDAMAKLSSNENPWGPLDSVMEAMNSAWKYSNRYGYPDAGIVQAIADHHKVTPQHILLGAGSGEILDVVGTTYLQNGKKVLGVEPTYSSVYQHATSIKSEAIRLPLNKDYTQNMQLFIDTARRRQREIGVVYLCNPNNPTGIPVSKNEVKQLLDGLPADMPVLVDEAYFHFVQDPNYATALPYVLEGRPVIIARTFSKIFGIAAMRLGYAVAPPHMIQEMRPYSMGSINALVKWGGAAGLADTAGQKKVLDNTIRIRTKAINYLKALGFDVLPTETNFFMVGLKREVQPVIEEFRKKGVAVGRPFPPMTQHLRVSVGTDEEMARFMTAFKEIFPAGRTSTGAQQQ